jgi:hypothetical protein
VSAKNGPLNIAVNWQAGALDLGSDEDEVEFVKTLCQRIRDGFDMALHTSKSARPSSILQKDD